MALYQDKKTKKWKVEVWYQGKRHRIKTFSKKSLAEKFRHESIGIIEKQKLSPIHSKDYYYDEIFSLWYENAKARKRHSSLVKDLQMHTQYISPTIGKLRISEILPIHFDKIVSLMITKLSKASVNKVIQHFKAVFHYSFNNESISRNPAKSFKQLRIDYKEMDYLSQDEMDQLLTYTSQKYQGAERWKHTLYLTLFLTGSRLGEILGLEWHHIQFDRNTILIGQIWCAVENKLIYSTKGKKDRTVPLNSFLKTELGAIRNFSKGSFVFSNDEDRPIDSSNFRNRHWLKDLKDAEVRRIRIHDARHTYASLFMMSNGSLYDLKEVLGHTSIKTTERYAHLSNKHLANIRDIIKPSITSQAQVLKLSLETEDELPSRSIHAF